LDLGTNAWTKVQGGAIPPGVIGCMATWMPDFPGGGRAVVFGGGANFVSAATYAFDPVAHMFTKLNPAMSPPGRADGKAIYDPGPSGGPGRVLIHAGMSSFTNHFDDMWAFDGMTWSQVMTNGMTPPQRRVQGEGFDPVRREWVVFSGTIETKDLMDLWLFDAKTDTWNSLPFDGAPKERGFASFTYVPGDDAYYGFGGLSQPLETSLSDGFSLHLR
jgi:hypothetical protein